MLRFGVVALGVSDRERAATFWEKAIGYRRRLDGFGGWPLVLEDPADRGAILALQSSESPPERYPRIHLDLHVDSATAQGTEVERLVGLGAELVAWDRYPDDPDFVVLADTEGNVFCVVNVNHPA